MFSLIITFLLLLKKSKSHQINNKIINQPNYLPNIGKYSQEMMINESGVEYFYAHQNHTNLINRKKTVFITGATGVMGKATLDEFVQHLNEFQIKLLVRPSKQNKKMMAKYLSKYNEEKSIEIIWGDLSNYNDVLRGVKGSDYVLHIGGLVSPRADTLPYLTQKINIGSAQNIVKAVLAQPNRNEIKVCYIGSVAETGNRNYPIHWGRTGDPIKVSIYDHYGLSKVLAERVFVESGIRNWVVMRQSGILHPGLFNNMDPIIFNVPMNDVLEWCTVEDSGRLMLNLVKKDNDKELPKEFWNRFYNIGSGENYRLTNYEFENLIFENIGLGKIDNSFKPNWFSSKNFHGHYYIDSDLLENYLKFRENVPTIEYFQRMIKKVDFYYRIANYLPFKKLISFFVKMFMRLIASTKTMGTLDWIKNNDTGRITAFYGSLEEYKKIPTDWKNYKIEKFNTSLKDGIKRKLNHGYNEDKPLSELDIDDLKEAAKYRGGEVVSKTMVKGVLNRKIMWKCGHCGHTFMATPALIILGGHWCPHCYIPQNSWNYDSIAKSNPFFAQVWYHDHKINENNVYHFHHSFNQPCYLDDPLHPFHGQNFINNGLNQKVFSFFSKLLPLIFSH
ncbi:hypothetical protein M9Y10_000277 [Tritrichomonas musculus]|uniref:NAD-dependent epimerase/dehydratase domain-containing protein n=1 Tax=Tritrichomonas musculus TaxID=1915356 RepID=A0ABR2L3U2_9EUKA